MSPGAVELKDTRATKMLATALRRAREDRGLSVRQIGKMLNYKQAVVLSHMAHGRVPIPIDRVEDLAEVLELDKAAFLGAVVEQRHPHVNWSLLSNAGQSQDGADVTLVGDLETIAGAPLSQLTRDQRKVMREVAGERNPTRRWLSVHEVPVVEALRALRPSMVEIGLEERDLLALREALRPEKAGQ